MEDAAVLVIGYFYGRVDAGDCFEGDVHAVGAARANLNLFSRREISRQALDVKNFCAGEAERFRRIAGIEFER